MEIRIRRPIPSDASDLGRLNAEAWHIGYEGLLPTELLAGVTAERSTATWKRITTTTRGQRQKITVADIDGKPAGFAWTGPCRDDGSPRETGELYALYVAPERWRAGIGTALITASHQMLTADGFGLAILWVLRGNERAMKFYSRHGWRPDGVTRDLQKGKFVLPEARFIRPLQ